MNNKWDRTGAYFSGGDDHMSGFYIQLSGR